MHVASECCCGKCSRTGILRGTCFAEKSSFSAENSPVRPIATYWAVLDKGIYKSMSAYTYSEMAAERHFHVTAHARFASESTAQEQLFSPVKIPS